MTFPLHTGSNAVSPSRAAARNRIRRNRGMFKEKVAPTVDPRVPAVKAQRRDLRGRARRPAPGLRRAGLRARRRAARGRSAVR